jgi:hypothetical protein
VNFRRATLAALVLVTALVTSLAAHHSIAGTYDSSKAMNITGTVTELRWQNPHTWLSLDVKGADGKIITWKIEMGGPANFAQTGLRKDSISISSSVTIQAWPARDGSLMAAGRLLTLPDGKQFDVHDRFGEI